ncbi:hypothetical protein [Streptomyces sp. XD-27]|uniref:hypothetical protein n=1 Tax=Streptomyces sp. XD-27 TaxID=3062779 RepID=UPI0026F41330|nr:hypothetical protein [Streptomyces sp. XD-27]WKX73534.1 hypothetical protein Q3Y56_29840 [Streptomyces sp. XD-27]
MPRPPLPRLPRLARLPRAVTDGSADVLQPLLILLRGLRELAARARRGWLRTPKDRRGPVVFLAAACLAVIPLIPYGPLLALLGLMGAAAWAGRGAAVGAAAPGTAGTERLQTLYDALVPYFSVPQDCDPLYRYGGVWTSAFEDHAFDEGGRLIRLRLRYPAYFTDGEPEARRRVEQLLYAKSGRGREYLFDWDEEGNRLHVTVLPPLSTGVAAQRFVTAQGETVLGFTDPGDVARTLPVVVDGGATRDASPVVWRTGPRSAEPHLLALGQPGSGVTTLLRSIVLQVLQHGDVTVVDGGGTGDYAFLTGRPGVLAVECDLAGTLAMLEWAAHETERRLIAANRSRQHGRPLPEDVDRPLWLVLDRPSVLGQLAAAGGGASGGGRRDPVELLQVPLRYGRAANVTVVVADHCDSAEALGEPVWSLARARVVLGPAPYEYVTAVLGEPPHTTPVHDMPPGRGYARLGAGPVHRLQVPATPDPYDSATGEQQRQAVLGLLPQPPGPTAAAPEAPGPVPGLLTKPGPVGTP